MKKKKRQKAIAKIPVESTMQSNFDILGSYTGAYLQGELEEPVQDADDL